MLAFAGGAVASAIEGVANTLAPAASGKDSVFLQGNFAPVSGDAVFRDLVVLGTLPEEVSGMFLRVGPNPGMPVNSGYHVFDGDGMVHGVRLQPGSNRATYSRHQIETAKLSQERAYGRAMFPNIGSMRGLGGLARLLAFQLRVYCGQIRAGSTANTALVQHAGRLLALNESDAPYALRVAPDGTISTEGALMLQQLTPFTAHPKVDPETGMLHAFGYKIMGKPGLRYYVLDAAGKLVHSLEVPLPKPIMMHDFAITKNYVLFLDFNVVFDPSRIVHNEVPFKFDALKKARIGVMRKLERDVANIKWVEVPAQAVFHVLNAFENTRSGNIEMVAARMMDFSLDLDVIMGDQVPDAHRNKAVHYDIDINKLTCKETVVLDLKEGHLSCDFPVVNPRLLGRESRFGFIASFRPGTALIARGVHKLDLARIGPDNAAEAGFIPFGEGCGGGECVFVPRDAKHARGEDDGFLLTFVYDETKRHSHLCIWDAYTMNPEPVARVLMPQRVTYGFHGTFVPESDFEKVTARL